MSNQDNAGIMTDSSDDEKPDGDDDLFHNEPVKKKLRYIEPDLKIVLRYTNVSDKSCKKEYLEYSTVLAKHSNVVDTALSSQGTKEIVFQDVRPQTYVKAIQLLEEPVVQRTMTPQHALDVLGFYDKYEFPMGLRPCHHVFYKYFEKYTQIKDDEPPQDLELFLEALVAADQYELTAAKTLAISFVRQKLQSTAIPFGATMFTQKHFQMMQPLFVKDLFPTLTSDLTQEELESALLPKLLLARCSDRRTVGAIPTLKLLGSGCQGDVICSLRRYQCGMIGYKGRREGNKLPGSETAIRFCIFKYR